MPTDYATDRQQPTTPTETTVVRWPEPSPLDTWWTEIMEGVSPPSPAHVEHRARSERRHVAARPAQAATSRLPTGSCTG